jgi:hypothetical protein
LLAQPKNETNPPVCAVLYGTVSLVGSIDCEQKIMSGCL